MSHTVVRGQPTAAQLYLDTILDEVVLEKGLKPDAAKREAVSLPELMFHCLKRKPKSTFMINGATGEVFTNEQMLKRAVSLARALVAAGAKGKHVMLVMRNHQHALVVYLAVLLAGVVPFLMDPTTTVYEITHFLNLIEPLYIFYDREHHEILHESLKDTEVNPTLLVVDEPEHLMKFVGGTSDDVESFQVAGASPDDTVIFLPTSGSTGLPKAAALTHRGTIAQLSPYWAHHTKFPTPTDLLLVLTSIQWATFTMMVTTGVAYHIPLLLSPKPNTVENVIELLERFRPTWTFFAPAFASALIPAVKPDQLSSLEYVTLLGAPSTPELKQSIRAKLPKTAQLHDGYGSTEAQGFIVLPDKHTPINSNGPVVNFLHYKIVDDNEQDLGKNQTGELWVKGASIIKKYHKNNISYDEAFTRDGWYKTGDVFHVDENERLTFVVRKKFSFKFRGAQVSPEEVERVIFTVPGIHESVVCATNNGPAAAIVKQPNAEVTEEQIHKTVNASLSDHKRLHGGIIFVSSLPHTHTGKVNRKESSKIILNALSNGIERCY